MAVQQPALIELNLLGVLALSLYSAILHILILLRKYGDILSLSFLMGPFLFEMRATSVGNWGHRGGST